MDRSHKDNLEFNNQSNDKSWYLITGGQSSYDPNWAAHLVLDHSTDINNFVLLCEIVLFTFEFYGIKGELVGF